YREARLDVRQLDSVGDHASIRAGARPLECDRHASVALNGHPSHLNVAEERHTRRPPVFDRVRKDVDVHERAPVLAGAELTELSIGMPEADRGLSRVDSSAEHLE